LGALPAVAKAAAQHKKPFGFDAEDFHRQEIDDDVNSLHYKICSYMEDKYLPAANYLTASSPLIAEKYGQLYNKQVMAILNVFPKTPAFPIVQNKNKPLKLFWFSQTIGPGRGLELVISAIGQTKAICELHLLGQPVNGYKQELSQLAQEAGIANYNLYFYEPVKASQLFNVAAQFDVGLASETGTCLNRDISLTNKLFTYIQCGIAVAASNTSAQTAFMAQYPQTGKIYNNAKELSTILSTYNENRELLYQTKKESFEAGQAQLNWENESQKFLNVIENTLNASTKK
jgi:glycosyltransferase involved in cell wall biosynthesis